MAEVDLHPTLAADGFDLVGLLSADRYDALVGPAWQSARILPGAQSAVLLACGGSALYHAARRWKDWGAGADPVDRFTRHTAERQCDHWRDAGFATECLLYSDRREFDGQSGFADFAALAVACGLGVPSRLRILLHPRFGPWWSIRALLLTERECEPTPPLAWSPCDGCAAPCAQACPSDAVVLESGFDLAACFDTRETVASCRTRCAARGACVVGPDQAYEPDAEAYFAENSWRSFASARDRS